MSFRMYDPSLRLNDKIGSTIPNGRLRFFENKTQIPKAVFKDPELLVPHEIPLVLDSDGSPPGTVWMDALPHTITLHNENEVLEWDEDDFRGSGSSESLIATDEQAEAGVREDVAINPKQGDLIKKKVRAVTDQNSSFTLDNLDHGGRVFVMDSVGDVTVEIPGNSSTPHAVGVVIEFFQRGNGQIIMATAGGVTLRVSAFFLPQSRAQYSSVQIKKIKQDEWFISGDLELNDA